LKVLSLLMYYEVYTGPLVLVTFHEVVTSHVAMLCTLLIAIGQLMFLFYIYIYLADSWLSLES
jgi:hypothetical protein